MGLETVSDLLQQEVVALVGTRYSRKGVQVPHRRWGRQNGSVYLADQKLPVSVPRVRNVDANAEVSLESYQSLQVPRKIDEGLLLRVLKGISSREYKACAEAIPGAFGLSSSSVSRRFIKASARKLKDFQERSLQEYDLVALFIDGKTFADQEMLIALGITIDGEKVALGFIQAATENERVCRQFIRSLIDRGLRYQVGLLVIVDGSKGLYNAIVKPLKGYVCVQRCQWHKRENVVSYLPKNQQVNMRRKLQSAYNQETYQEARSALNALKPELVLMNRSASKSLEEGFEETLTLHRLGLIPYLKTSFRTTNCLESINSQVAQLTRNVKLWKNSHQRCRWLASALLDIEPRSRKVKGTSYLPLLRQAIQKELNLSQETLSA